MPCYQIPSPGPTFRHLGGLSFALPYATPIHKAHGLHRRKEHGIHMKNGVLLEVRSLASSSQAPSKSRAVKMVAGVDHKALRAQAVPIGDDRAVTVNKRSLIDKQLSRYSRPWSTLRELIQNAADASASRVVVKIDTTPSLRVPTPQSDDPSALLKHVLHNHTISQWVIENDGYAFRPEDWARLQEIASGNPDEDKIGAFGVGFYSVFSISEKPYISSGSEALEFYWKDNDLRTTRFKSPEIRDTVFQLPARDTGSSVPHGQELFSLCEFLTGSMTFVGLQSIELFIDGWRILHLQKSIADAANLGLPTSLNKTTSEKLMRVNQVTQQAVQLEVEWMKALESTSGLHNRESNAALETTTKSVFSFFKRKLETPGQSTSKPEQEGKPVANTTMQNITTTSKHKAFFHINRASLSTNVNRELGTEFLRLRKKPPPKVTTVSFLAQSYDERAASKLNEPVVASKLFMSVVPENKGHVYIGFVTSQTTGLAAHLEIPALVPTVEREQLDLNSKHIKEWNAELLRAAGIVARISWSSATMDLQQQFSKYPGMTERKVLASHELREVNDFSLFSSRGFVPLDNVRVASVDLSFVEELPTIPEPLMQLGLIKMLREGGDLKDVQIQDIVTILEKSKKTRTPHQLQHLLTYLATRARANTISQQEIRTVLNATVASDEEVAPTQIIALNEIKEYINPDKIPPDMPAPPSTISFKYTKKLSKFDTDALGFRELEPLKWLQWLVESPRNNGHLTSEQNLETSPAFASNVLKALSKNWTGMSQESKTRMVEILGNRTVIPTKQGMKKPSETYFSSVKLFADLPVIVSLPNVKEGFLSALGVRKTLEIGVVFDRLMSGSSQQWSHVDLIKYLASVWDDVPNRDRERLKSTPICPAEALDGKPAQQRYRISELYEPSDALRRLGLPILQWPGEYSPRSKEARLLATLGLRDAPPYTDLVNIIATAGQSANSSLREFALKYFIENSQSKGYNTAPMASVKIPFLPIQGSGDKLSAPADCFINERVAALGFDLLRSDLHKYAVLFGVQTDPLIDRCIQRLTKKPPRSKRQAREVFGYMTSRIGVITNQHVELLGSANIVPITTLKNAADDEGGRVRHLPPRMCFLGDGSELASMFDFVDFGKEAELFLLRCGSKQEPTIFDIALLLTQQPAKMLDELDPDRYLEVLIKIANQWASFQKNKSLVERMRQAPFLLATKVEAPDESNGRQDDDEKGGSKRWHLAKASDVVIVDEIGNYNLFKYHVLAAPQQDESLEAMYEQLGVPGLSSLVEERQKIIGLEPNNRPDQRTALKLQSIIRERTRLFLYDYAKESLNSNRDSKWLESNLIVQTVRSIVIKKSLKGTNIKHVQEKTATMRQESNRTWTICITEKYNMAQVARVLARLLLVRPKPRDSMVLTEFLRSEISGLQEQGINVDRILRQKEKEARVAQEMHQRQLEQEQRARDEREALQQERNTQGGRDANVHIDKAQDPMPGNFPGSHEGGDHEAEDTQGPATLFGGFKKMLGLDSAPKPRSALHNGESSTHDDDVPNNIELELPYPESELNQQRKVQGPPTTPQQLHDLTQKALQTTRPHTSSTLRSEPSVHKVEEMHTTCDAKPGMNVVYTGQASNLRVFLDDEVLEAGTTPQNFMKANHRGLEHFTSVLQDCASVYKIPQDSLQIFYDAEGTTMAFNQNKSLFFNYRYFQRDHLRMLEQGNKDLPVRHWATTMAHELSHNIEVDHNVRFQNVFQALIETHIPSIADVARTRSAPPVNARPLPPPPPPTGTAPPSRQTPPPPRQGPLKPPSTSAFKGAFKR
ncbi:MAG: hypothetical protein Q9209_003188 [Squamulea sp. 1 TL-2023]